MVLVVEKKFLEDDWWKYATALFLLQVLFWVLLGYRISPDFSAGRGLLESYLLIAIFAGAIFLPFVGGRLQFRRFFWFGFVGLLLAFAAYYALSLLGLGKTYSLLPFVGFMQVYVSGVGLGAIVEFGGYVLRKLEE